MKGKLLAILIALAVLPGCGPAVQNPANELPGAPASQTVTCRIVDGAEEDALLLAPTDENSGELYRLNVSDLELDFTPRDGQMIAVSFDGVMESYPAQFFNVSTVELTDDPVDDRCGLYLQVLEDLWAKDDTLNEGLEVLGLDLSGLSHLSAGEKAAVMHRFGELHGLPVVVGTMDELLEQGYITAHPLMIDGAGVQEPQGYFYEWENGILYSIDTDEDAIWHLPMLSEGEPPPVLTAFSAQKWRTSLGAYGFSGCSAQRAEDGSWRYTISAEFIS